MENEELKNPFLDPENVAEIERLVDEHWEMVRRTQGVHVVLRCWLIYQFRCIRGWTGYRPYRLLAAYRRFRWWWLWGHLSDVNEWREEAFEE